jgi:hypothetical protein
VATQVGGVRQVGWRELQRHRTRRERSHERDVRFLDLSKTRAVDPRVSIPENVGDIAPEVQDIAENGGRRGFEYDYDGPRPSPHWSATIVMIHRSFDQGSMMPRSKAIVTACVRSFAASFESTLRMWAFTLSSEMARWAAMISCSHCLR